MYKEQHVRNLKLYFVTNILLEIVYILYLDGAVFLHILEEAFMCVVEIFYTLFLSS